MKEVKTTYWIDLGQGGKKEVEGTHLAAFPGLNIRKEDKDYFVDCVQNGYWVAMFAKKSQAKSFIEDIWALMDWRKEVIETLNKHPQLIAWIYNRAYGFEKEMVKPDPVEEIRFGQESLF